mmetsp:Transcript_6531/g.12963  ORF Transcript_6531/g.12963 Transcript_6531/m.12963 type:complete len:390 (+) Transcript_6531:58-1227(+)
MSDDEIPDLEPIRPELGNQTEPSNITDAVDTLVRPPTALYSEPVPVLLLTGYLGSGKTTLVNHILTAKHGYKCAILMNEVGDTADIEKALVREPEGQEAAPLTDWVELENGCICCSVKNEMVKSLESLLQQRTKFDYIIIETTGLANPGPVASALWTDPELETNLCLDAIVTVVDAVNISRHLSTPNEEHGEANEAQRQLAFADIILLNKLDLIDGEACSRVRSAIREINADAKIIQCIKCDIDLGEILHTGIYSGDKFLSAVESNGEEHVCSDICSHGANHAHKHDVRTYTFFSDVPLDINKFRMWLDEFLWEEDEESAKKHEVYRIKGLLHAQGSNNKSILQAVHELYDIFEGKEWEQDEVRHSKLVFIGKNLQDSVIADAIEECKC